MPEWLTVLAELSLVVAVLCAAIIAIDIARGYRQHMSIMNVVWPVTALYAGPLALWAYFRIGRLKSHPVMNAAKERGEEPPGKDKPFWQSVMLGATHCGSGCSLGDLIVESFLIAVPLTLFGSDVAASWTLDYIVAFAIGIAFQYFSIKPMSDDSAGSVLKQAIKADTLSLTAWQVGMYGWMAIAIFAIFDHHLPKTGPVFWFMMQIAMLAGFATASPVNAWLIRRGIKEAM
ncbi:DUF4396 domain-containing protein [Oleiagrimonas sp. C23AA]|uniref:DUF4396 domain-containing protein n=1 Tax=Oleiagrimonas sp. C23AA TaxID=2719047 RepID=UPI00141DECA4|nr:DUF4396 domain-containing protein [Oleiagrimonas sp. C23AA]NII09079.1 DUF4396 domain-containing protein [Oleiagrimonas sp. C23AA]